MTTTPQDNGPELDVRIIPPPQKHSTIFGAYNLLEPGRAFTLVNDHDPRPLYHHFKSTYPGKFDWDYLEEGPRVWKVRIGKKA